MVGIYMRLSRIDVWSTKKNNIIKLKNNYKRETVTHENE